MKGFIFSESKFLRSIFYSNLYSIFYCIFYSIFPESKFLLCRFSDANFEKKCRRFLKKSPLFEHLTVLSVWFFIENCYLDPLKD